MTKQTDNYEQDRSTRHAGRPVDSHIFQEQTGICTDNEKSSSWKEGKTNGFHVFANRKLENRDESTYGFRVAGCVHAAWQFWDNINDFCFGRCPYHVPHTTFAQSWCQSICRVGKVHCTAQRWRTDIFSCDIPALLPSELLADGSSGTSVQLFMTGRVRQSAWRKICPRLGWCFARTAAEHTSSICFLLFGVLGQAMPHLPGHDRREWSGCLTKGCPLASAHWTLAWLVFDFSFKSGNSLDSKLQRLRCHLRQYL